MPALSPSSLRAPPLTCSLYNNEIGAASASILAAVLKETNITDLKCATAPECSHFCQRHPLTLRSFPWQLG